MMINDSEKFAALQELALNIQSYWNHSRDELWRRLDPDLWEATGNPWAVLQTVSQEKLKLAFADHEFCTLMCALCQAHTRSLSSKGWFDEKHPNSPLTCVAYFSMEFMLAEALAIYSGGLGNVAGDQLKAASDLDVPVVGVGLLYSQGYFRQFIDLDGNQQEFYPYNDPGQLPIKPLRLENGEWLRLKIELPGWSLWLRTWEVQVGKRKLYLLDSNDIANFPAHRGITSELYGGDSEMRLKQELVLGIGGWRLLRSLGLKPEVCHLNEGHAAFVVLERAFDYMKKTNQPFNAALSATRAGNLFTTHTAAPAGFDRFESRLVEKYLKKYAEENLKIPFEALLELGRLNESDGFNMAYLAIRGSGAVNGVSRLHGKVSRRLFSDLFPRFPVEEVPITSVTNGVHFPTWDSLESDKLWTNSCGKSRWLGTTAELEQKIRSIPDEMIWKMRNDARKCLVEYARERLSLQLKARGAPQEEIESAKSYLDPNVLTLGFARRFATYKRPDLLLADPERLARILTNKQRPVQLIIAGKAHPKDGQGHELIKKWMRFICRPVIRSHVVFISDYDMSLTQRLVSGVDLWINTPKRPWEASGTSGMKVLVNGGLNLSELDGWWAEAYCPEVGWAIGDGNEHGDDHAWDGIEAGELYDLLEKEITDQFYEQTRGIPLGWVTKIRESMARLTPQFSANRTVREYTERFYLPQCANYLSRAENDGQLGQKIACWSKAIDQNWNALYFESVAIEGKEGYHLFEAKIHLAVLDPQMVKVELYSDTFKLEMKLEGREGNLCIYNASVPAEYSPSDFTARILPFFPGVSIPLEQTKILWQK